MTDPDNTQKGPATPRDEDGEESRSEFIVPNESDVEPMTWSLLGRLFGVPLVIITVIVGVAVLVVLLFGSLTSPKKETIAELLARLEGGTGERTAGLLPPHEKELWQAAVELSMRLEHKADELDDEQLATISARLIDLTRDGLANAENLPQNVASRTDQLEVRSRRLGWMISALGQTGQRDAVQHLIEIVRTAPDGYRMLAIRSLGELHGKVDLSDAVEPILEVIASNASVESRALASHVIGLIAMPGDPRVEAVLTSASLSDHSDVSWNAALALARLGSEKGRSVLLDLLDRDYLENEAKYIKTDASGVEHRYPLPASRIDMTLLATMDATKQIDDARVQSMVLALTEDPSAQVRARALELTEGQD